MITGNSGSYDIVNRETFYFCGFDGTNIQEIMEFCHMSIIELYLDEEKGLKIKIKPSYQSVAYIEGNGCFFIDTDSVIVKTCDYELFLMSKKALEEILNNKAFSWKYNRNQK